MRWRNLKPHLRFEVFARLGSPLIAVNRLIADASQNDPLQPVAFWKAMGWTPPHATAIRGPRQTT
jgi:hypothetical protein